MRPLRYKLNGLASKKVPALSLILVGIAGMVAGVLAATLVTQYASTGTSGSYRTNSETFTVNDLGLAVVANTASSNLASGATIPSTSTNVDANNDLTAGHWAEVIRFSTSLVGGSPHTATITVRNDSGPIGALLTTAVIAITPPTSASSGTVTVYVDLGGTSVTSPLTVFVDVA